MSESLELVKRLDKDLVRSMALVDRSEARFLVTSYYQLQDQRERTDQQLKSLGKEGTTAEVLVWLNAQFWTLECQVKNALKSFADGNVVSRWSQSLVGIGPVISAGLLAHIDIERAPTVGHIWSFAGLNPGAVWKKGEKRPWNADLKVLCWHIGQCFMRTHNHEKSFYGPLYRERKAYEAERNLQAGDLFKERPDPDYWRDGAWRTDRPWLREREFDNRPEIVIETAFRTLATKKIEEKETLSWYKRGMLPPGRIEQRAERWVTKVFLAHWHAVAFEERYGTKAPKPYILTCPPHSQEIAIPNWPMQTDGDE